MTSKYFMFVLLLPLLLWGCFAFKSQDVLREYEVKRGDSLYSIARRFGIDTAQLQKANKIKDASKLSIGQIIGIPGLRDPKRVRNQSVSNILGPGVYGTKKVSLSSLGSARNYIGKLVWPVSDSYAQISSRFGWRGRSFHEGIDVRVPIGTPVYAAHGGKVIYNGRGLSGYGWLIAIKSPGLLTMYAHNSSNLVAKGTTVRQGQLIAISGATGQVTGPHLHFESRVVTAQGKYMAVNPLHFFG